MSHRCNAFCQGDTHCSPFWQEPIDGIDDPETYVELLRDILQRVGRVRVVEVRR